MQLTSHLRLQLPAGHDVEINSRAGSVLYIHFAGYASLREFFRLYRALPFSRGLRALRKQPNPLGQPIELQVAGKTLLQWPAGRTDDQLAD